MNGPPKISMDGSKITVVGEPEAGDTVKLKVGTFEKTITFNEGGEVSETFDTGLGNGEHIATIEVGDFKYKRTIVIPDQPAEPTKMFSDPNNAPEPGAISEPVPLPIEP